MKELDILKRGLNVLPYGIFIVDENNKMIYFNKYVKEVFDYPDNVTGTDLYECHSKKSYPMLDEIVKTVKKGEIMERIITEKGGKYRIRYIPIFEDNVYRGFVELSEKLKKEN